ncbi:MAG: FIG01123807: hypothetical protein, partial [uncultured Nocardioidaceae bacterium]
PTSTPTPLDSDARWRDRGTSWRPAVDPARWKRPTWGRGCTASQRTRSTRLSDGSPPSRPSAPRWTTGHGSRSRCWPPCRTRGRPSASRRGSTVTSRRTPSPVRSRSTSATPSARTPCSTSAPVGSSSSPAPPARCRRSSRTPARTTTPSRVHALRWCWSAASTGPRPSRHGRCCKRWEPPGTSRPRSRSSTPPRRSWRCSPG